jgi:hypothetical protein
MTSDTRATREKLRKLRRLVAGTHRLVIDLIGRLPDESGDPAAAVAAAHLQEHRRAIGEAAASLAVLEERHRSLGRRLPALRRRAAREACRLAPPGGQAWYESLEVLREVDHFEAATAAGIDRSLADLGASLARLASCLEEVGALLPARPGR